MSTPIFYLLCGNCLHSRSSHEPHNGHFMYCACCRSLCELDDFNKQHEPTDINTLSILQSKREYSNYQVKT